MSLIAVQRGGDGMTLKVPNVCAVGLKIIDGRSTKL